MTLYITKRLHQNIANLTKFRQVVSAAAPKKRQKTGQCVISCKRSQLDHYTHMIYDKFDQVPLASNGWNHNKSKGDYFTVNPIQEEFEEHVSFRSLGIDSKLIEALNQHNITAATPYQAQAFPLLKLDKHLLLGAETGCGKTLAYLLPIVQELINTKSTEPNTPKALILVPNRELAYQIGEFANILAETVGLRVKTLVGGKTKKIMLNPEFREIDILVATPGALGKLANVGVYKLNQVLYAVLDEADTLIDDSFEDRITGLVKKISHAKLILVSATVPRTLPDVLKPIEPSLHQLLSPKLHMPLTNITEKFLRITRSDKPSQLINLVRTSKKPMLVFTNRSQTSNWLALFLRENNIPCSNINGDMNYAIRIEQWNNFMRGETQILSCTDVASRGLDTTRVVHALNYDFPVYSADYLHRIGRVGRIGSDKSCKVTNFISGPEEVKLVQQIEYAIRKKQALLNVDGNITNIVQKKIMKGLRQNA